jgi:hypothetical protein
LNRPNRLNHFKPKSKPKSKLLDLKPWDQPKFLSEFLLAANLPSKKICVTVEAGDFPHALGDGIETVWL